MCLVAIEWRRLNGSGLVLLANREEFRDRPGILDAFGQLISEESSGHRSRGLGMVADRSEPTTRMGVR